MEDTQALMQSTDTISGLERSRYCDISRFEFLSHNLERKKLFYNKYLILATILASSGGILFGYDLGVVSGALIQLQPLLQLSCFQQEMVISSMLIGSFITSFFAGYTIDYFGRKNCIIVSAILYCVGAIIISTTSKYVILIVGRLLLGSAMAMSSTSECVYVSEISPPSVRGTLVSFNELGITLGFLFAFGANAIFAENMENGWRWMFAISTVFALVMLLTAIMMPCSPRYLLLKNRVEEAQKVWHKIRLHGNSDYDQTGDVEWIEMKQEASTQIVIKCSSFNSSTWYSLFLGVSLVLLQQSTGQPNLLFYASIILTSFGFRGKKSAPICSVWLGLAKLISTLICITIVDKVSRKKLLIFGCLMMVTSLMIVSICVLMNDLGVIGTCNNQSIEFNLTAANYIASNPNEEDLYASRYLILFALVMFVSGYAFGFGPITWILLGEIFPTKMRGKAFSLTTSVNWGMNLLISSTFLDFSRLCGSVGWSFLINAILCLVSIFFVHKFLPETRNKSLEEVQNEIDRKVGNFCLL